MGVPASKTGSSAERLTDPEALPRAVSDTSEGESDGGIGAKSDVFGM